MSSREDRLLQRVHELERELAAETTNEWREGCKAGVVITLVICIGLFFGVGIWMEQMDIPLILS